MRSLAPGLAMLVALLVSCSSEQGASNGQPTSSIDPNMAGLVREASSSQKTALADGKVTFAEYETAVFSTVECIKDKGIRIVSGPEPDAGGWTLKFSYSGGPADSDGSSARSAYGQCYREYQDLIDQAWAYQNRAPEATLAEARKSLVTCLRERGVDVSAYAAGTDISRFAEKAGDSFVVCINQVQEEFGIPGFGG